MNIRRVSERSKRDYLQLLLLADEQEDMIDRYLGRGTMFALDIAGKTVVNSVLDSDSHFGCEAGDNFRPGLRLSLGAGEPGEPGLPKRLVEHHGSGV